MFVMKNDNIKNLEAVNDPKQWLAIKHINNEENLVKQYSKIYLQNYIQNKWILIINPENSALESMGNIYNHTFSKILKVNTNKGNINIENIATALQKGNCSVIVLNNVPVNNDQLSRLYLSAKAGSTECIILNNKKLTH